MKSQKTIIIPAMPVPVLNCAAVIVVGGGVAGVAAAIAAARHGADTILIEKFGCAGGTLTSGLLPSMIYLGDGEKMLAGGICKEVVDAIAEAMRVSPNYHWHNVDSELAKQVLDDLLIASGVTVYYGMDLVQALKADGKVTAVVVNTPSGLKALSGECFIDCTGDGILSMLAGAGFEIGDQDGNTMAPTLCLRFDNVNYDEVPAHLRYYGMGRDQWAEAVEKQTTPFEERHFVGVFRNGKRTGAGNLGHIYGFDPMSEREVSRGYIEGRRQARMLTEFFRSRVPGFREANLGATAGMLGVRESRRIKGDYVLNQDDYLRRRHFFDDIGSYAYSIDIHSSKADAAEQKQVEKKLVSSKYAPGENYGIPYRSILVAGLENLMVAGRCISTDRVLQSSIRPTPGCMITGEAAGIAAALAGKNHCALRSLDIKELQREIRKAGNYIPEI